MSSVRDETGWGMPINQPKNEPMHWWTTECKQACNSDGGLGFAGEVTQMRQSDGRLWIPANACPHCVIAVKAAQKVLG